MPSTGSASPWSRGDSGADHAKRKSKNVRAAAQRDKRLVKGRAATRPPAGRSRSVLSSRGIGPVAARERSPPLP